MCKNLAIILSLILLNTVAVAAEQSIQQDLIHDKAILAEEYSNIGSSFLRLKKYHKAIENFDITIKYDPSYASAYNSKGTALDDPGKPLEAIEIFNINLTMQKHIVIIENYDTALLDIDQSIKFTKKIS
ncbi:tetratricopeptide repeat protein [Orientia tsutsugamushi]|uniref:tetratricopeptide repeat protein n=1 Tax=Orientia tsutsugamushi TaxID=784 RepID=UPI003527E95C